jgi:two-component system, NtrC family, nitrogen regulation sensor histidine kinase NtrY
VSQRTRLIAYLVVMHVLLAAAGGWLVAQNRYWLIVVELIVLSSAAVGITLVRRGDRQLDIARAGIRLIAEGEFTSRFLPVGEPAIDPLIAIYNTLIDKLRDERTRLQEQHHFLGHVVRLSPSAIVIFDFDGRIAELNPAAERMFERRAAELIGLRIADVASPLMSPILQVSPGDARVIGVGGARRLKCQRGTFIDRGFRREFLVLEELTDELRQAERAAYEKLIRVMAHEVNNSVAASNSLLHSSLVYAPELGAASRADFEQALGIVIARTAQLNAFMRRFADVFRLPAPARQEEDLTRLVGSTVRLVSARPEAAAIKWVTDLAPDVRVDCDRGQIEQALLNIVQNAVEAAGANGTVAVRLHHEHRAVLTVEDDGPGIAVEAMQNLFTPFFSTKSHGQGIGLTLVQEILSAHGCEYRLERAHSQWTRFTIVFEEPS